MKYLIFPFLLLIYFQSHAQLLNKTYSEKELANIAREIQNEAKLIYNSEVTSWNGTDLFLQRYQGVRDSIGGYFSYQDGTSNKCVFFSVATPPRVIATISFDTSYSFDKGFLSFDERQFSTLENEYYTLRKKAFELVYKDTLFKRYDNTNFNIVPIITRDRKDVYVMTGTNREGTIVLGNDYLISYDKNGNLVSKKALHASLLAMNYPGEANSVGQIHTHLPDFSPFITPTDVCTAMLYEKITGWKQYTTVSEKYISIWNGMVLMIVPTEKFRK